MLFRGGAESADADQLADRFALVLLKFFARRQGAMLLPQFNAIVDRTTSDGRMVGIRIDMLGYVTNILTPQLADPQKPRCCHVCFAIWSGILHRDDCKALLSYLLLYKHDFFAKCTAALAAPRSHADLMLLRARFEENCARCPNADWHPFVRPMPGSDPLEMFLTGLIACVKSALDTNVMPKGWFKAQTRKGSWPTSPDQLLPYGPLVSVASYVSWCHTLLSPFMLPMLKHLMDVTASDVRPALLASLQKDMLMQTLITMLHGPPVKSTHNARRPWVVSMWTLPPDFAEGLRPQEAALTLMYAIEHGRAAMPDDLDKLCAGYEAPLYDALLCALDSNTIHINLLLHFLCSLIQQIHEELALPPSAAQDAVNERLVRYWDDWNVPEDIPREPGLVSLMFIRYMSAKACSGAGCRKPGKQACSRCRVVRYCSKACQRKDWTVPQGEALGVSVAHKALCPVICRLNDAGVFLHDSTTHKHLAGLVDAYGHAALSHEEFRGLVSWGCVTGLVPPGTFLGGLGATHPFPSLW